MFAGQAAKRENTAVRCDAVRGGSLRHTLTILTENPDESRSNQARAL